jgi:hypothetical protein
MARFQMFYYPTTTGPALFRQGGAYWVMSLLQLKQDQLVALVLGSYLALGGICSALIMRLLAFITSSLENVWPAWHFQTSMVASAGETDRDLAGRQFPRNFLPYNIIEF